jgi:hypothetical protein
MPVTADCVDCERLCGRPKPGVAGELGGRASFKPSVLAFCRGGSKDLGKESSRDFRLRFSTVDALRPRVVACVGETADRTGDLAESFGLVSLVFREAVRLLGEVGTGLFASPLILT